GGRDQPGDRHEKDADDDDQRGPLGEEQVRRDAPAHSSFARLSARRTSRMKATEKTPMQTIIRFAIAEAKPMVKNSSPCLTAELRSPLVPAAGPPLVVEKMMSKTRKASIVLSTRARKTAGSSIGRTIIRKR